MKRTSSLLVLLAAVLLTAGWWWMWFLCDDAYIAFRYVRMAQEGHGYTWNPPPFRPVEGYTSFLWVVLLDALWSLTGIEPPRTANVLSLLASVGSLLVIARMAARLPSFTHPSRERPLWLGFVLLAVCTNTTWLMWSSSGLETALWTLTLLLWCDVATRTPGNNLQWMGITALLPLIRPDGLLYLALTPPLIALKIRRERSFRRADVFLLLPLSLPLAHILWRWQTYGDLLPNTYYAKVVDPWPLMGGLYAALFLYEHALWLIPLLVFAAAWKKRPPLIPSLAIGIILAQLLFLLRAGGDHFAYRIFMHWVPLLWLSLPWAAQRLGWSIRRGLMVGALIWSIGLVLPWTQYLHTSASQRQHWELPHHAIAPYFPRWMQPWPALRDWVARWQNYHLVGTPHHLHRAFLEVQRRRFPSTPDVEVFGDPHLAVWAHPNPGFAAYHLPELYVIDMLGLNDHVIARTPPPPIRKRKLAHEHIPPPGYIDCFKPNVALLQDAVVIFKRTSPFDEDTIRRCEDRWWEAVRR